MNGTLIRTLALGYGVALAAAAAVAAAGAGLTAAALTVWIGGAAVTLGLSAAAAVDPRGARGRADEDPGDALLAEAIRQLEEDRLAEGAGAADRRAGRGAART